MSRRNPIRGRRRRPVPGDRVVYLIPAGPPAEAIDAYAGDVQSAITSALTMLALSLRGAPAVPALSGGQAPPAAGSPGQSPDLSDVVTQSFFDES